LRPGHAVLLAFMKKNVGTDGNLKATKIASFQKWWMGLDEDYRLNLSKSTCELQKAESVF